MKTFKQLSFIIFSFGLLLFVSGCEREWSNPFDDKSAIDPESWAPQNLKIQKISTNELRLSWEYSGSEKIEGFKIDRKVGNDTWVIAASTLPKNARSWHDTYLPENMSISYRIYAYAGNNKSLTRNITANTNIVIGDYYEGGIVFYLDGNGGGLVCAERDQSTNAEWGCYGTTIGGNGTNIGTGAANTAAIVAGCSESGIAARICNDLVLNGYSDWFLPSKDELELMYKNLKRNGIGGFAVSLYWSSSEYSSYYAWRQDFYSGSQYGGNKEDNGYRVRAVRAF
jgi:hypothetical protein